MQVLVVALGLPVVFVCDNGSIIPGEHALCLYLYLKTYPTKLQRAQKEFGREFTQLSSISNRVKAFLMVCHGHKVQGNLDWYADRFDIYADSVNPAVAYSPRNQLPGTIPPELLNIVGFLTQLICRITVNI